MMATTERTQVMTLDPMTLSLFHYLTVF